MARVSVIVMPKEEVLDPQGRAVLGALHSLGFQEVSDCRVGKVIRLSIEGSKSEAEMLAMATEMSKALLANPVTEDFTVTIEAGRESRP